MYVGCVHVLVFVCAQERVSHRNVCACNGHLCVWICVTRADRQASGLPGGPRDSEDLRALQSPSIQWGMQEQGLEGH